MSATGVDSDLSAPATSDNRGDSTGRKVCREVLQNLLPSGRTCHIAFQIFSLGVGESCLQCVCEGRGDVDFDLEVPNGNVGRRDIGEGEVLLVVVRDVPFWYCRFVKWCIGFLRIHLLDLSFEGRRGHAESLRPGRESERARAGPEGKGTEGWVFKGRKRSIVGGSDRTYRSMGAGARAARSSSTRAAGSDGTQFQQGSDFVRLQPKVVRGFLGRKQILIRLEA